MSYKDCLHKGCLLSLTRCRWLFLQTTCPLPVHRHSLGESQVLWKEGKWGSVGVQPQYSHFNWNQWGETNSLLDFWTLITNPLSHDHSRMSKLSSLVLQETWQSLSIMGAGEQCYRLIKFCTTIPWQGLNKMGRGVSLLQKKSPYSKGHLVHRQGRNES